MELVKNIFFNTDKLVENSKIKISKILWEEKIMKEFKYVITDPEGIHARPAGELVKATKEFQSAITLTKDGKTGDCKRIFGIMGLAVKAGNEITLTFDGEDEEAAYAAVTEFVKANL